MNQPRPQGRRPSTGPLSRTALLASGLALALLGAACSDGGSASSTTTTQTTTTTTTAPQGPDAAGSEADEPPEPEWIVQIGGPANDTFSGVSARGATVVSSGSTEGALQGDSAGSSDVLVAVVGTDASVLSLDQVGSAGADEAFGIGSADEATVTCGVAQGDLGTLGAGSGDAWCAPVDAEGIVGPVFQQGGIEDDRLQGTAMFSDGTFGYAAGYTLGLFPGASDTSAGLLGQGDALLWQMNPDGTPRWIRQFGTAEQDLGQGVTTTSDGDAVLVGYTEGALDGASRGGTDGFVARYDREGLPRWTSQFGTSGTDLAKAVAVGGQPTRGNETIVTAGSTDGALAPALGGENASLDDVPRSDGVEPAPSNAGGTDAFVHAVDSAGNEAWSAQLGSEGIDEATGVAVDGSTVLVTGTTQGALATTGDPAAGGKDGFLAALDLDTGALRWITEFGSPEDDIVNGLTITGDGLVVVCGQTSGQLGDAPNAGGSDAFLIAFPLPKAGGSVASVL